MHFYRMDTTRQRLTDTILDVADWMADRGIGVPDDLAEQVYTLKARSDQEPDRTPEEELAAELEALFLLYGPQFAAMIAQGEQPDTSKMDEAMLVLLLLSLGGIAVREALQRSAAIGVSVSIDAVNRAAVQWAQSYGYDLVRGINETTRQAIQNAMTQFARTPGMGIDDVARMLEPTFGSNRANMIAVTETTRAQSRAVDIAKVELEQMGLRYRRQWVTYGDDRVCPICSPLHNKYEDVYRQEFPEGPPAHVRCRCWIALVRTE